MKKEELLAALEAKVPQKTAQKHLLEQVLREIESLREMQSEHVDEQKVAELEDLLEQM